MDMRERPRAIDADDLIVGQRLRDHRKVRRMTLDDVAGQAGMSPAQLSLIERGLASPSVKGLREICRALQISVAWILEDDDDGAGPEGGIVVRRHRRKRFSLAKKTMHKELLTPDLSGQLQFLLINMQPGGSSGSEPYNHHGEETGLVLSGQMELEVDGQTYLLEAGDSFHFDSTRMHRFANPGDRDCRVIWVTTPPFY